MRHLRESVICYIILFPEHGGLPQICRRALAALSGRKLKKVKEMMEKSPWIVHNVWRRLVLRNVGEIVESGFGK